ncbi:MAG: hypothetical protein A2293_02935 [Elusimicrobia bacterium RIFOXYB2_FULL_49_7]|nr:MAG: hypothetical protein A2293_02935 [Elusimicrobia bacterium RIFOXYB2_FULL_49_7]
MAKILVMLPNNPGDVLMATPALRSLKADGHTVHFLVDEESALLVRHNANIDCLHVLPRRKLKEKLSEENFRHGILGLKEFLAPLFHERFDKVVNLFQGDSTAYLASLLDCSDTVGGRYTRKGKLELVGDMTALLYAIPFARRQVPAHACDLYTLMCGTRPDGKGVELSLPNEAYAFAEQLLSERSFSRDRLVVFHPCAAHRKKEWPAAAAVDFLKRLEQAGYDVILTGSAKEQARVEKLRNEAGSQRSVNLCGTASFLESAAVMNAAVAVVSGDTVAMHMAAAVGGRAIALFAPTSPLETGPYAAGSVVFVSSCLCFGDYAGPCSFDKYCTQHIGPDQVLACLQGGKEKPLSGIRRLDAQFDPTTGLMDYQTDGYSAYASSGRAFLRFLTGTPASGHSLSADEDITLERFSRLLSDNSQSLNMMKRLQASGKEITDWLKTNRDVERRLNLCTGPGALLAAFLRLKNNAIGSEAFQDLVEAMLDNVRNLSMAVEAVRGLSLPVAAPAVKPKVALLTSPENSAGKALDYQGLLILPFSGSLPGIFSQAESLPVEYLFFLSDKALPAPGCLNEMVRILSMYPDFSAVCVKGLNLDDIVIQAGWERGADRRYSARLAGKGRFDSEVSRYAFIPAAPLEGFLVRKRAFISVMQIGPITSGPEAAGDFCEKLMMHAGPILYCPEAEVYLISLNDRKAQIGSFSIS